MSKSQYEMLREFQKAFLSPCNDYPVMLGLSKSEDSELPIMIASMKFILTHLKAISKRENAQVVFRSSLLLEEIIELLEAKTLVDQVDALVDIHYLNTGNFVEMGVNPERPFQIVHEANMTKVWPDGKVHFNEFGKVIKPDTFVSPEPLLADEVRRQVERFISGGEADAKAQG